MTIYINFFDDGTIGGERKYYTSFDGAVSGAIDWDTGQMKRTYSLTVRVEPMGGALVEFDLTVSVESRAEKFLAEDSMEGIYDRRHNDSLRQPSII